MRERGRAALPDEGNKKLLIIDGHSLAHRAYHALPVGLTRPDGMPTNAVLGFCNMVVKLLEQEQPEAAVCAFDTPTPTFRHEEYEDYKATRKPMDDALRVQMPTMREAADVFGFEVVELDGWEADDVIGSVARNGEQAGYDVIIVTGDRDALQLASDKVRVMLTRRGITEFDEYGREEVIAKYGFGPELVPDLKGLMGDVSDNIPGVPGVGEKTAIRLITQMGSVEQILGNAHSIKQDRLRNILLENAELARKSKHLATIDTDAPVEFDIRSCCSIKQDRAKLRSFLQKQGFRTLINRLKLQADAEPAQAVLGGLFAHVEQKAHQADEAHPCCDEICVDAVCDREGLNKLADSLRTAGRFAFDVPVAGRAIVGCKPIGIVVCAGSVHAYVSLASHAEEHGSDIETVIEILGPVFSDESVAKLCHDVKRQVIALKSIGIKLSGVEFDSMIGSYLADPAAPNAEVCDVAEKWLGLSTPKVLGIFDQGKRGQESVQPKQAATMICECLQVMPRLEASIMGTVRTYGMEKLYKDIEMPLAHVLADVEMTGVAVDTGRLQQLSTEMQASIDRLIREVYDASGEEFNINSTKQLGVVLFEKLGLPPMKKTKTGYSTDAEVLESLAPLHPVVGKILDYRTVSKLKSTYVDALPQLVNATTGRIHTSFNQTVTATGRLSSTDPNLQNIPIRTEEGRKIREVFIAGMKDWVILSADYSQIELRVLAHISGDQVLIDSFKADEDIHRRTAAEVFGVPFDEVTPDMRSRAKAVNFGIVYGISDFGLARNIGVSPQEAKEFIAKYFERYRGVRNYMDSIVAQAKADGYVTTLMNRRRYLPELASPAFQVRKFAERVAMNTPIQGTAADIIKRAMVDVHSRIAEENLSARLLLQVHDELVIECPQTEAQRTADLVRDAMGNAAHLAVPLRVDVAWGHSWMDAK